MSHQSDPLLRVIRFTGQSSPYRTMGDFDERTRNVWSGRNNTATVAAIAMGYHRSTRNRVDLDRSDFPGRPPAVQDSLRHELRQ
jgi:hypothetical protein